MFVSRVLLIKHDLGIKSILKLGVKTQKLKLSAFREQYTAPIEGENTVQFMHVKDIYLDNLTDSRPTNNHDRVIMQCSSSVC